MEETNGERDELRAFKKDRERRRKMRERKGGKDI